MAQWNTFQPDLSSINNLIEPITQGISSVLQILIKTLNIASTTLKIIRAFAIGVLDPIVPLLKLVIKELKQYIDDFRNLGLYLHGDWNLLDPTNKFSDIVGGYDAYQQRMVRRLLDPKEPNRPDFSANSGVISLFLYVGAEIGEVGKLVNIVNSIVEFFGETTPTQTTPYNTPVPKEVLYKQAGSLVLRSYKDVSEFPTDIAIKWGYPNNGGIPFLDSPAPKGYIIHVSTLSQPLDVLLWNNRTKQVFRTPIDPITNTNLKIYGGIEELQVNNITGRFADTLKVAVKNETIPYMLLEDITPGLFGKTFCVSTGFMDQLSNGQSITSLIPMKDLPLHADLIIEGGLGKPQQPYTQPTTYYIYIRGVVDPTNFGTLKEPKVLETPIYTLEQSFFKNLRDTIYKPIVDSRNYTKTSNVIETAVPDIQTLDYKRALITSIATLLLLRVDYTEAPTVTLGPAQGTPYFADNTVLTLTGLEFFGRRILQKYDVKSSLYKTYNKSSFCNKIMSISRNIANDVLTEYTPLPSVLRGLQESINAVNTTEIFPFLTLYDLIDVPGEDLGLAANPLGVGNNKKTTTTLLESGSLKGPSRAPSFLSNNTMEDELGIWVMGTGSGDMSPVFFDVLSDNPSIEFVRNTLSGTEFLNHVGQILISGVFIPQPKDKGWIPVKIIQNTLPQLDTFFDNVQTELDGLLEAAKSNAEKIDSAIQNIENRIQELEAFVQELDDLINSLLNLSFPPTSALLTVSSGTSGVVGDLVGSENKPPSSPTSYGAGAVAVFGGLPEPALEFILSLFGIE